eukprot:TRINITY_DN36785_c0_g1_i1.p1 TRINITY_DN36785_c0_g1~~TRINITY_DN36785_c0_g1_i1.p1  ORF type:complete len:176 (+),score=38.94 TRINITY_DN36785_c0_g1_i1:362-889(+)
MAILRQDHDIVVEWAPFQLKEDMPQEGLLKKGSLGATQVPSHIREMGKAVWIEFTGLCPRTPNTLRAHELMLWARTIGTPAAVNKLQEIIFRQYFTDGIYPDMDALASAANEAGFSAEEAREALQSERFRRQVQLEVAKVKGEGITSVPTFFVNGQLLFSGPQSPEAFLDAFRKA